MLGSGAQPPTLPDPEWVPAWCYKDARFGPPRYRDRTPSQSSWRETRPHSYGESVAMEFIHCLSPAPLALQTLLLPFPFLNPSHLITVLLSYVLLSLLSNQLKLLFPHRHLSCLFWNCYLGNLHLIGYTWCRNICMVFFTAFHDCTSQKVLSLPQVICGVPPCLTQLPLRCERWPSFMTPFETSVIISHCNLSCVTFLLVLFSLINLQPGPSRLAPVIWLLSFARSPNCAF